MLDLHDRPPRVLTLDSQYPPSIDGLFLERLYDPGKPCYTDDAGTTQAGAGDAVALLPDQSGRGRHAYQTTANRRGLLSTIGTGAAILLDGTDDHLLTNYGSVAWTVGVPCIVAMVVQLTAYPLAGPSPKRAEQGGRGIAVNVANGRVVGGSSSSTGDDWFITDALPHRIVYVVNGNDASSMSLDGLAYKMLAAAGSSGMSNGSLGSSTTPSNYWPGKIGICGIWSCHEPRLLSSPSSLATIHQTLHSWLALAQGV